MRQFISTMFPVLFALTAGFAATARNVEADDSAPASQRAALPKLASRFAKGQLKTLGPAGPLGPPEASAPAWLEGEWSVTYTFEKATFPLGNLFNGLDYRDNPAVRLRHNPAPVGISQRLFHPETGPR